MLWVQTGKSKNGIYKIPMFSQGNLINPQVASDSASRNHVASRPNVPSFFCGDTKATQAKHHPKMIHGEWYIHL